MVTTSADVARQSIHKDWKLIGKFALLCACENHFLSDCPSAESHWETGTQLSSVCVTVEGGTISGCSGYWPTYVNEYGKRCQTLICPSPGVHIDCLRNSLYELLFSNCFPTSTAIENWTAFQLLPHANWLPIQFFRIKNISPFFSLASRWVCVAFI